MPEKKSIIFPTKYFEECNVSIQYWPFDLTAKTSVAADKLLIYPI